MTAPPPGRPDHLPVSSRALPLVLLLFVGSGCAALVYEIVWFQLLQLVIGSTAVSLGILLATFMGGMCLGSLLFPRIVSARRHPLRVYAVLEVAIGVLAVLVLLGMPQLGQLYITAAARGFQEILLRGALAALCLLPPAALMGATLPAIARWVETTPRGVSWLGVFYGGNTIGAVGGCLLGGFYLLRVYDMPTATWVAVAINLAVAVLALAIAHRAPYRTATDALPPADLSPADLQPPADLPPSVDLRPAGGAWPVYGAIALSGTSALGAEVIWTRLFSFVLGGTTYTFSIILAVFLTGIGIGSSLASWGARRMARPRLALGICQLLLVAAIAWTAWTISGSFLWVRLTHDSSVNTWTAFGIDLARCATAILPAACLWGASFSLALAALAGRGQDGGRLVGKVYAANAAGAIAGALAFSLLIIPSVGTQQAQRALMGLALAGGLLMLVPLVRSPGGSVAGKRPSRRRAAGIIALSAATVLAAYLVQGVRAVPIELIAYGRLAPLSLAQGRVELYRGEGVNSTIAVTELNGNRYFHVSGKVEASTELPDMRVERMLANLPAMLHPDPHSVLVVGFGAGVTAGSFLPYYDVRRLVICEIEPLIPPNVGPYFSKYNLDVLNDPVVELVYDDARHFVLTTDEHFDIITSDPIHPYIKGAAMLYTQEYFEQVRAHLKPGGLVTQWVPLYESNLETIKSEIATFLKVFPHGTVWCNPKEGEAYDVVLLGSVAPLKVDLDALRTQWCQPEKYKFVRMFLNNIGFATETDLLGTFLGEGADSMPWLAGAEINRDMNLRLQYLAGFVPAKEERKRILDELLAHRKYPQHVFSGSDERQAKLKEAMSKRP